VAVLIRLAMSVSLVSTVTSTTLLVTCVDIRLIINDIGKSTALELYFKAVLQCHGQHNVIQLSVLVLVHVRVQCHGVVSIQ